MKHIAICFPIFSDQLHLVVYILTWGPKTFAFILSDPGPLALNFLTLDPFTFDLTLNDILMLSLKVLFEAH